MWQRALSASGGGGGGSYRPIGNFSVAYGNNGTVKGYAFDVSDCNSISVSYRLDNPYYSSVNTYFVGNGKTEDDGFLRPITPSTSTQTVTYDVSNVDVFWLFLQITNEGARTLSGSITKVSS